MYKPNIAGLILTSEDLRWEREGEREKERREREEREHIFLSGGKEGFWVHELFDINACVRAYGLN